MDRPRSHVARRPETQCRPQINQKIGVDHYDNFLQRIPCYEVKAHADIVANICAKADMQIRLIVSRPYLRGAADSGDFDLAITERNTSLENIRTILIDTVIPVPFAEGFLKVGLATSSSVSRDKGSKWHGASALPGSKSGIV